MRIYKTAKILSSQLYYESLSFSDGLFAFLDFILFLSFFLPHSLPPLFLPSIHLDLYISNPFSMSVSPCESCKVSGKYHIIIFISYPFLSISYFLVSHPFDQIQYLKLTARVKEGFFVLSWNLKKSGNVTLHTCLTRILLTNLVQYTFVYFS